MLKYSDQCNHAISSSCFSDDDSEIMQTLQIRTDSVQLSQEYLSRVNSFSVDVDSVR